MSEQITAHELNRAILDEQPFAGRTMQEMVEAAAAGLNDGECPPALPGYDDLALQVGTLAVVVADREGERDRESIRRVIAQIAAIPEVTQTLLVTRFPGHCALPASVAGKNLHTLVLR